jgi:hypothetical protein
MRREVHGVFIFMSFDGLRTNGYWLIPFVVSASNHERN